MREEIAVLLSEAVRAGELDPDVTARASPVRSR
jgi:hypothetical protein